MPAPRRGGNRQPELFARCKRPAITLPENHPIVVLTETVDWTELEIAAEKIRRKKLRKYRLFAKDKTKEAKNRMVAQMTWAIEAINKKLGKALAAGACGGL